MEVVKSDNAPNTVSDKMFAEMKRVIKKYRGKKNRMRAARREMMEKFPEVSKEQWIRQIPFLFANPVKQIIKKK